MSREEGGTEPWEDLGSRRRTRRDIVEAIPGVLNSVHGVTLFQRHRGSWVLREAVLGVLWGQRLNGKGL